MQENAHISFQTGKLVNEIFHAQVGSDYYAGKLSFDWAAELESDAGEVLDSMFDNKQDNREYILFGRKVTSAVEIISTRNVFLGTVFKCVDKRPGGSGTLRFFAPSENILKNASNLLVHVERA